MDLENIGLILAPSDFSDASASAVDTSVVLARRFDAAMEIFEELTTAAAARLRLIVDEARRQGVRCTGAVELGRSARSIVAHARRVGADLIVLGNPPRHGLGRLLLRSVADKVVEHAPCSILIVPSASPPAEPAPSTPGFPDR